MAQSSTVGLTFGQLVVAVLAVFSLGIGVVLLLPTLWGLIPWDWARDAYGYLLSNAGNHLYGPHPGEGTSGLEPWQDVLGILAWVVVSLVGAALLLKRRDA